MPESAGVVDAGVVLTRLERRRRGHSAAVALFGSSARLHMSTVNLAEALEHAGPYTRATGVDLVAVLAGFGVTMVAPDVDTARHVARLSGLRDASLADRFALATARALGARLHTTDRVLAGLAQRARVPVTLLTTARGQRRPAARRRGKTASRKAAISCSGGANVWNPMR